MDTFNIAGTSILISAGVFLTVLTGGERDLWMIPWG